MKDFDVGEIINRGLKNKGMTQVELADRIGVSRPSIAQWISGKNQPTLDKFFKVVEILELHDEFSIPSVKVDTEDLKNAKDRIRQLETKIEVMEDIYDGIIQQEQEKTRNLREKLFEERYQKKKYCEKVNQEILDDLYLLSEQHKDLFIGKLSTFIKSFKDKHSLIKS